jgi:hypothetical protein
VAEQNPKTPPGPKVSPARTIVSLALLLIVGVVCIIELRAGLGQMLTGKAMAAKSEDGVFTGSGVTLEEAKGMLSLAPSESIERDDPTEIVYRYEWFSLLRPLMGETSPQLFLVTRKGDTPVAVAFHTSAEEEPETASSGAASAAAPPTGMPGMMGPPGGGGPPGGAGAMRGGMGGGMGGNGPPPDGVPPGALGVPGRQRPAVEGDESTAPETTSEAPSADPAAPTPEETPAPAKKDEAPSKTEPETTPN